MYNMDFKNFELKNVKKIHLKARRSFQVDSKTICFYEATSSVGFKGLPCK